MHTAIARGGAGGELLDVGRRGTLGLTRLSAGGFRHIAEINEQLDEILSPLPFGGGAFVTRAAIVDGFYRGDLSQLPFGGGAFATPRHFGGL